MEKMNEKYIIKLDDNEIEVSKEMFDFVVPLGKLINELQQENKKQKEVIDNIKYYLEENGNKMSEDATYDLINFIKEV